jgi:hypothetical protein
MTEFKTGTLSTESSNVAGTAMNSKSDGTTTFIADIDNTTDRDLYLPVWGILGSITTAAGASVKFELRRKRGSTYAMNAESEAVCDIKTTGAGQKDVSCVLQLPLGYTYGLYWTNNTGTTSAGSGNELYYQAAPEADA